MGSLERVRERRVRGGRQASGRGVSGSIRGAKSTSIPFRCKIGRVEQPRRRLDLGREASSGRERRETRAARARALVREGELASSGGGGG